MVRWNELFRPRPHVQLLRLPSNENQNTATDRHGHYRAAAKPNVRRCLGSILYLQHAKGARLPDALLQPESGRYHVRKLLPTFRALFHKSLHLPEQTTHTSFERKVATVRQIRTHHTRREPEHAAPSPKSRLSQIVRKLEFFIIISSTLCVRGSNDDTIIVLLNL